MKIVLSCTECDFAQEGSSEKNLMNKIVMWNHLRKMHPNTAERIMKMYQTVPNNLYHEQRDDVTYAEA